LLVEFLVSEKHDVFAIGIGDDRRYLPAAKDLFRLEIIPHTALDPVSKIFKYIKVLRLIKSLHRFRPELFIASGYGRTYAELASYLKKGTFCFYQEIVYDFSKFDILRRRLIDAFDAVAVQSQSMKAAFIANIKSIKPVACLPCFSNPPLQGYIARLPESTGRLRLAYFGRLAANKGIVSFLKAFSVVKEKIDATFDIYGDGDERSNIIQRIEALNLSAYVGMHGAYPNGEDYAKLLTSYHALVLPSVDSEGLPLILLEAMGYGLSFLATDVGAISDVAVDNPDIVIVKPDEASLTNGLLTLSEALRNKKVNPGRLKAYYNKNFSYEVTASKWLKMLENPKNFFTQA
jgi:glycosyltransferase involved in cell wall biosynthesis